jgi:ribosome biogenesis SPOUT family RNA methylase Rps3
MTDCGWVYRYDPKHHDKTETNKKIEQLKAAGVSCEEMEYEDRRYVCIAKKDFEKVKIAWKMENIGWTILPECP